MKTHQIVEELKQAAEQLGYRVRAEKGNFRGGRCVVGSENTIMLNRRHAPETQLVVLAECLRDTRIDDVFLRPAVRSALEEVWLRNEPVQIDAADDEE